MSIQEKIQINLNNVITSVENIVQTHQITYLEAICLYCEQNLLDVEQIAPIIKRSKIKSQLQSEGEKLRLIKKVSE